LLIAMTVSRTHCPVGLVTALQQEFAVARKCLGADSSSFILAQSGVGRAAGYIAAEGLGRGNGRLAGLVSLGFCGGLDPALGCGSVVVPRHVITPDAEERFDADEAWHASVMAGLANLHPCADPMFSARDVITSAAGKRQLHERYKACAVDMESAGIAHAARRLRVPFLAIRIVLDGAGDALPHATADAIKPDGNLDIRGLMRGLARHPKDVPALMVLGRKSSIAQGRLKAVCEALKPGFAVPA
jgi:adenosylhomocysteine nucleosidase